MAVIIAFVPPLIMHTGFTAWFQRALTFLVISCPCALVISVPLSFLQVSEVLPEKEYLSKEAAI